MIDDNESLKSTENFGNAFDYHIEKSGLDCLKKLLEYNWIHSSWPENDVNIDELDYTDGGNKTVKIFYQKRVIFLERDSDFTFKQCGHQCICDQWYQNKDNIVIKKCIVFE